jgi:hypothetical protein
MANGTILDTFFVQLGFEPDLTGINIFQDALVGLQKWMGGLSLAALGALGALGLMLQGTITEMADVNSFAEVVGQSANEIFSFAKAAMVADVTLQGWESTVQSLTGLIGQASLGIGRGAQFFKKYGIEAKNADGSTRGIRDVLKDVADKMQGMDQSERLSMAQRLGIDVHAIALLKDGSKSFDDFYAAAIAGSNLTDTDFALADNVDKGLAKLKGSFNKILRSLTASALPLLMPIIDAFLVVTNSIVGIFNSIFVPILRLWGEIFGAAVQSVVSSAQWVTKQISQMKWVLVLLRTALFLVTAGFVRFYAVLAVQKFIPFLLMLGRVRISLTGIRSAAMAASAALGGTLTLTTLVLGAVAIAALVVQDLWTYFNGGDSVVGRLIERFPALKGVIAALKPVIDAVGAALPVIWDAIVIGWKAAVNGIAKGIEWTVDGFLWISGVATSVFEGVFAFIKKALDGLKDVMRYLGLISSAEEERKAVAKVWTSPTDKARAMLENLNNGISQNVVANLTNGGIPPSPVTPLTAGQKATVTANTVDQSSAVYDNSQIHIDKVVAPDADKVPEALRRAAAERKSRARNAQSGVNP